MANCWLVVSLDFAAGKITITNKYMLYNTYVVVAF